MRSSARRFTVSRKITAGLAVVIVIGMLSMLLIYRGLYIVDRNVQRLAEVDEPLSAASYEMELNVNGIGFATLKYFTTLDTYYRRLAEKDERDFAVFYANYVRLARTEREQQLAREIEQLYLEFQRLGRTLMNRRDEQEKLFIDVTANLDRIDDIIDRQIEPALHDQPVSVPANYRKAIAVADLEAEAAEIGFWLLNYQRSHSAESRQAIFDRIATFNRVLADIQSMRLTARERSQFATISNVSEQMMASVRQAVAIQDTLIVQRQRFIDLRLAMDDRFDDQIQVLARQAMEVPRREAEIAAHQSLGLMQLLIPLYLLSAIGVGILLVSRVTRPLKQLKAGANAISQGDLTYRVKLSGNDEFADLGERFNLMVEQLQTTTVSKRLLEESEEKLQDTVSSLRQEIREREALQAELRSAETMSAMGALVAGVAHEVRNPLFGISSTLDAMDVRLRDHLDFRRHLEVLRTEITRLSKLMNDLLEYGKPVTPEFSTGAVLPIIHQAIDECARLAVERGVTISVDPAARAAVLRMNSRLVQVFQNLIENAVQHSPAGEAVIIVVQNPSDNEPGVIDCIVLDAGSGFSAEDLPRLFEPFFTRRRHGTGLGLAIVQRIVAEHDGKVFAYNRPKGGGAVAVRLPLAG